MVEQRRSKIRQASTPIERREGNGHGPIVLVSALYFCATDTKTRFFCLLTTISVSAINKVKQTRIQDED